MTKIIKTFGHSFSNGFKSFITDLTTASKEEPLKVATSITSFLAGTYTPTERLSILRDIKRLTISDMMETRNVAEQVIIDKNNELNELDSVISQLHDDKFEIEN